MIGFGKFSPAFPWRAFFIFTAGLSLAFAGAPVTSPGELAQVGKPDAAEAARILDQFRQSGIAGEYYFEFELRELPRRGPEKIFHGRLWGGRNEQGAITRVVLADGAGRELRFLVQNGARATVWRLTAGKAVPLGVGELFEPVVPGVELTTFDLQMPFLYWPDASVERLKRIRGRPAYEFMLKPPAVFAAQYRELAAVRSYFDTQFNAPMQTELIDSAGRVTKTLALLDLKKIGGQMIPKSFEVRNETTRDKTRFVVTAVALELSLAPAVFTPAALAEDVRPPSRERIVQLDP